jgi:hypothetical protein
MARWSSTVPSWTVAATADATNLADATHHTLRGGSATQRGEVREVYEGGLATASAPSIMLMGRISSLATGALSGAARLATLDPSSNTNTPPLAYTTSATNKAQRSATAGALVNLSFNAYGGLVRWYAGPDENVTFLGAAVDLGDMSLSAFTGSSGTGVISSTIIFEVV